MLAHATKNMNGILNDPIQGKSFISRCDAGCFDYLEVIPDSDWKGAYYFCLNLKHHLNLLDRIKYALGIEDRIGEMLLSPNDIKNLIKFLQKGN
jgi:hypothetical protein